MSIYITTIGKHRFICGLFWQSLSRPRELMKEAADLAKKIDSDLVVLRKDPTTAQAGFAHTKDGVRRMTYSLGAAVSKTLSLEGAYYDGAQQPVHNWLGAFKLPDGKWAYFAVRDDNFLPNGDFAGTRDEVLERLHGDYGLGGWNVVIGDAELEKQGFHNFNAKQIEELLPHTKDGEIKTYKWWGLRPINKKIPWRPIAIISSGLIAIGIISFIGWQKYQQKKYLEEQERALENARLEAQSRIPAALIRPWPTKPLPEAMINACVDKRSYLTAGGWLLEDYVCTPNQVSYSWFREDSTVEFLLAQVPNATINMNGEQATYSEPLDAGPGQNEPLLEAKQLIEPMRSRLQLLGLSPKITFVPPPAPQNRTITDLAKDPPPQPDWKTFSLSLTGNGLQPKDVAPILNQPGVRLEKLLYRAGTWSIEGVMYAK